MLGGLRGAASSSNGREARCESSRGGGGGGSGARSNAGGGRLGTMTTTSLFPCAAMFASRNAAMLSRRSALFAPADASNTSSRLRALRDASPGLILGSHARVSPAAARLSSPKEATCSPTSPRAKRRHAATSCAGSRSSPYRRSACTSDIATCTASRAGRTLSKPHSRTRASTASTSGVVATVSLSSAGPSAYNSAATDSAAPRRVGQSGDLSAPRSPPCSLPLPPPPPSPRLRRLRRRHRRPDAELERRARRREVAAPRHPPRIENSAVMAPNSAGLA